MVLTERVFFFLFTPGSYKLEMESFDLIWVPATDPDTD